MAVHIPENRMPTGGTGSTRFMTRITGLKYTPGSDLDSLVREWLNSMSASDKQIVELLYGIDGKKIHSEIEVSQILRATAACAFMGAGRVRDRISRLRRDFHRHDENHKLYDLFVKLRGMGR